MALKPDRYCFKERIDCVTPTGVAIAAGAVLIAPASQPTGKGVGQGINQKAPQAVVAPSGGPPSGSRVLGVLMNPVVLAGDPYLSTYRPGPTTQFAGEPVDLTTIGFVWTDMFIGTPVANTPAYVGANSKWTATQVNGVPAAGYFDTAPGTDGFLKVSINVA
jgi:hypothetical protein